MRRCGVEGRISQRNWRPEGTESWGAHLLWPLRALIGGAWCSRHANDEAATRNSGSSGPPAPFLWQGADAIGPDGVIRWDGRMNPQPAVPITLVTLDLESRRIWEQKTAASEPLSALMPVRQASR